MALQSIKPGLWLPEITPYDFDSIVTLKIDAAEEKAALIVHVPKTGTISKILFRTGVVANSQTIKISLQTVVNGEPSGTNYGGSTPATRSPATNTTYVAPLGTPASATRGDLVAIVIEFDSTAGDVDIRAIYGISQWQHGVSVPYGALYTASWAKDNVMMAAFEYSDGSYEPIPGVYPFNAVGNISYNSGSTPDERALRFSLPFPCRVAGFWFIADIEGNADIVLYEGTTELQSKSFTPDERRYTSPGTIYQVYFDTPQQLSANTEYFLALKPTSSTNIGLNRFVLHSAAVMDCFSGGQSIYLATRTDAGSWSATTTERPQMGLIFGQFDDGVGGGGLLTHPGMSGGMRA